MTIRAKVSQFKVEIMILTTLSPRTLAHVLAAYNNIR